MNALNDRRLCSHVHRVGRIIGRCEQFAVSAEHDVTVLDVPRIRDVLFEDLPCTAVERHQCRVLALVVRQSEDDRPGTGDAMGKVVSPLARLDVDGSQEL